MSAPTFSSNTRATRSRFSSPQTAPNGATDSSRGQATGGAANGIEGQKQFMQRWLEPPVQVKPSYQDDGLVRHGVLENMAPLGTLPKAGFFKKTVPPPPPPPAAPERTPVRRIIVKRPAPPVMPAPAPVPPPAPEEDETEEEEYGETDDAEDGPDEENQDAEDATAATNAAGRDKAYATTSSSRSRRSLTSRDADDEEWAPARPSQKAARRQSLSRASAGRHGSIGSVQQPAANEGPGHVDLKDFTDKVVEAAVDEALDHFRYPTAWALRTLYDENSSNPDFLTMIEKVFNQTAGTDTLTTFAQLIHAKKKEGKKDNKGCYYFVPPATNSRFTPHKPKRAPYGNLINFDVSTLHLDQGTKSQKAGQSQLEREAEREPKVEPEAEPEADSPPRKKRKSARQPDSASKMSAFNEVNGNGKANGASTANAANAETPSRRKTRARSLSSSSTLSSALSLAPPDGIQEDEEGDGLDVPPSSRNSPVGRQPINNKRRRSNAPRKSRNVSPSRPSPAPSTAPQLDAASRGQNITTSQRPSPADEQLGVAAEEQPYEMPAVVDSPLFPNLNPKKGNKSGAPLPVFASKVGTIDENDERLRLRQKARGITNNKPSAISNARGSSLRDASRPGVTDEVNNPAAAAVTTPASRVQKVSSTSARQTPAPREGRSTRSSLKRPHDDMEEQLSPIAATFPGSEAASTAADSRAGTPALRATRKARTGLRVKNSPIKKKTGTSAGIPRPSGERSSPVGNGPANREDDNDDYCSSCGGNGELICCDGCTRSFHFSCVDPVIMQDSMPVEWFCNVCRTKRDPAGLPVHNGAFALILEKLDAKNSSAFRLPVTVRDAFEGVRTGADGEYEEIVAATKPARKKKSEEEQTPDYFRLRDQDGNPAICHGCQKSSSSNRAIIPCSVCGIFWHLDCLDPPLANPPAVVRPWKCPLHINDLLTKVPGALGPAHRFRKLKNVQVVRPAFSRGFANNGFVEIDPDDDEDQSGWRNVETYGRVVRLPEKGIKLDFLSRSRENRKGKPIPPLNHANAATVSAPAPLPLEQRTLEEQQAVLNLAQLSGDGSAGITTLIDAMISQADPVLVDMMARANPNHLVNPAALNTMDQQSLRAILASAEAVSRRVRELLAGPTPTPEQSPPLAEASSFNVAEDAPTKVPSLSNSQSADGDSDNAANVTDVDTSGLETDAGKGLASPAATDDVPAMTQGEKTPPQGDQSPAAPLEEDGPAVENGGLPVTPTKATAGAGEEPVVLEPHADSEKALVEDGMDID
ncbi:hypothetical protein N656DRAFT_766385 [Canariomyces notabilis]|uniref:PHD-type domain-containing protein n=1 Tax=Canariomyces notabilis TaxID=2074819 RepID=A0AAN6TIK4_9PEZI|nr:hypothetical protein N656DRAFT_766385 [Canariomyces arenarius]